jgi:hypothetical protein
MSSFNESEWLKLLFLLADTQQWLDDMSKQLFNQLPMENKQKKTYYLTPQTLAHIIERHYYKIPRHPQTGKFHIPLTEILHLIREAASCTTTPVPGTLHFQRIIQTEQNIGFDKDGEPTGTITIITDAAGKIMTAFPGVLNNTRQPDTISLSHLQ